MSKCVSSNSLKKHSSYQELLLNWRTKRRKNDFAIVLSRSLVRVSSPALKYLYFEHKQCTLPPKWLTINKTKHFYKKCVCSILDAWGWCTGTTQRDGMGREEGGGFRMGNTCIPVWSSNTLATWCEELTHWKRSWCWERLKASGKGDWQRMKWLDSITDSMDSKQTLWDREGQRS